MPFPLLPGGEAPEPDVEVGTLGLVLTLNPLVSVTSPTVPGVDRRWRVKLVDQHGSPYLPGDGFCEHANVATITKTLRGEDEFVFALPKYEATTAIARPLVEAQIWRGSDLKAWGPITGRSKSSSDAARTHNARGVWWYFRKLFFGTAERSNMIRNGDFELGPADGTTGTPIPGWARVGGASARHYTAGTKPAGVGLPDPLRGTKAVSLHALTDGENVYLRARFPYRTDFPPGQRLTFAAWVYIVDAEWIGPAAFGLGLHAQRIVRGEVEEQCYAAIDNETEHGEWVRLETSMIVRPHRDGYVEVRLYSPGGWVAWDESVSVLMESTGAGFRGADQTALAATIVRYGQTGRGKTSKNVGTHCPPSGVERVRAWQHADHDWLSDAVEELAGFPDGFDFDVVLTPSTRTFTTYFPRKGTDRRDDVILKLGRPEEGGTVASYTYDEDGASSATSVVSRGAGDGPDREEGGAMNLGGPLGATVLEAYVDAPANLSIGDLDAYAEAELDALDDVVEVLEVVMHPGGPVDWIDLLETGDLVSSAIDDGEETIDGDWRIVSLVIGCVNDSLSLTLNRWVE